MNVMDRLFGRKARTPDTISAALSAAREAMADAQARVVSAADRRKAAIASGDRAGAIAAEAERAAAEIDGEIAAGEVAGLEAGLAEAVRMAEAAARTAVVAALVERRRDLGVRLDGDWKRAAAVLKSILSKAATLARDVREAGAEREVERLPDVPHGLPMNGEALADFSRWLGDALSGLPNVPESAKERDFREHQAKRERDRAEAAETRRIKVEAERGEAQAERQAARERAEARERRPYLGGWRDHLDSAR